MQNRKEYGIAIFHHIGDVLCSTPIAKQLKADDPDCHITWYTSEAGEVAVRHNPYIDKLVILPGDQYQLDSEIPGLMGIKEWTRFFMPAAYLNYDAIPGGSIHHPKGTVFGIVKAAAKLQWTIPFVFPFVLTPEEIAEARAYWATLPEGCKILVETNYRSEQSPWTDDFNDDMRKALQHLHPHFVFTSKDKPPFLDKFHESYSNCSWCHLPFRLNAELFNLCDAYIGVSSGISCLTYSEYCRTDVPRIEVTRGEHWGAAELPHHSELFLCYSRKRFQQALANLSARLGGQRIVPAFEKAFPHVDERQCQFCGSQSFRLQFAGTKSCCGCGAIIAEKRLSEIDLHEPTIRLVKGGSSKTIPIREFFQLELQPAEYDEVSIERGLARIVRLGECIERISYIVKPNGCFSCEVPNAESLVANIFREQWPLFDDSQFFLTPRFLKELLIQAGFFVESFETRTNDFPMDLLLNVLSQARPDLSKEQLPEFLAEINRRGAGEYMSLRVRKRGLYKGFVQNEMEEENKTPRFEIVNSMPTPLVSIVLPGALRLGYFRDAFESVLQQEYPNWELLVVADRSHEEVTRTFAAQYAKKSIRFFAEEQLSYAEVRDMGAFEAFGEWILPLGGNDKLAPNYISSCIQALKREPDSKCIFTDAMQFGLGNRYWRANQFEIAQLLSSFCVPQTALFRKDLWSNVGGYNSGVPGEAAAYHFWLSCAEVNPQPLYLPEPLVLTRTGVSGEDAVLRHQNWRVLEALVRTLHFGLYSVAQILAAHETIVLLYENILPALEEQIRRFPGLAFPYLWRGLTFEQKGLFAEAISDYDQFERRRQRADWQVNWRRFEIALQRGDRHLAERLSRELLVRFPQVTDLRKHIEERK